MLRVHLLIVRKYHSINKLGRRNKSSKLAPYRNWRFCHYFTRGITIIYSRTNCIIIKYFITLLRRVRDQVVSWPFPKICRLLDSISRKMDQLILKFNWKAVINGVILIKNGNIKIKKRKTLQFNHPKFLLSLNLRTRKYHSRISVTYLMWLMVLNILYLKSKIYQLLSMKK